MRISWSQILVVILIGLVFLADFRKVRSSFHKLVDRWKEKPLTFEEYL